MILSNKKFLKIINKMLNLYLENIKNQDKYISLNYYVKDAVLFKVVGPTTRKFAKTKLGQHRWTMLGQQSSAANYCWPNVFQQRWADDEKICKMFVGPT